jgi:hypothetical protein
VEAAVYVSIAGGRVAGDVEAAVYVRAWQGGGVQECGGSSLCEHGRQKGLDYPEQQSM